MPIDLEKNGDAPASCRVNHAILKNGIEQNEKRLNRMENQLEIISEEIQKGQKEIIGRLSVQPEKKEREKTALEKLGGTAMAVNNVLLLGFFLVVIGKMDGKTIMTILNLLGGS